MTEYLYNIGDVVNGVIITHKCYATEKGGGRKKAYKYICSQCGYDCGEYYKNGIYHSEHMVLERNLKHGARCAICSKNGFVASNINSIHMLAPEIEKFLIDKNDALKYTPHSSKKLKCKCLDCDQEYLRSCDKLYWYGVPCVCGDGLSYPEKFVSSALNQIGVRFKPQYCFQGSLLRYDFYLLDYKAIVEVNGIQHYKQKWDRDEVTNDILKKEFALSQGILEENYIILNCMESNLEFITQSILNSRLNILFDCNKVNFVECSTFALKNLVRLASELWNKGCGIKEISEELKIHKHTTIKYLKQGNEVGWCDYKPGDGMKRVPPEQRVKNFYKNK